ncbi:MAG: PHP domain-containing protein [Oscillospiraceae bacterium]|jgi:predicted metal-dependent phosphoesterase TrpH|nr:PHP domain-containing protein [Oscillospiraceae bacterium]
MKADLHIHSKFSDGSLGMEDIIVQAKRTGVDIISITDHDTTASFSRASVLGHRYGVRVIPGIEISAWDVARKNKVHILCFAPAKPDRLEEVCRKSCDVRRQCANEMLKKVMQLYPITPESVAKYSTSSKSIFKQHILHALIEYGYAKEFNGTTNDRLFNRKTGSCYVEREYPDVMYVLDLIHSAKGLAIMAHPFVYDNIDLLIELAENGKIDGVEAFHYSAKSEQQLTLTEIAEKYKLIVTGGSDFHGLYNEVPSALGSLTTDKKNIDKIMKHFNSNS